MARGTVVAVDACSGWFALQQADGRVSVFSQHSGLPVELGNLLTGYMDIAGFRMFTHGGGFCRAHREAGPRDAASALCVVCQTPATAATRAARAARVATTGATVDATRPPHEGNHVDRIFFP